MIEDDRRVNPREPFLQPLKVRRPGSFRSTPGTVVDRSHAGYGLELANADGIRPGAEIELLLVSEFPRPIRAESAVTARVQWIAWGGGVARVGVRVAGPIEAARAA